MKNKKVYLIYGFSLSGRSALNLILNKVDEFLIYDSSELVVASASSFARKYQNVHVLKSVDETVMKNVNIIVVSPGISIYDNVIIWAKKHKKQVIGELELAYKYCKKKIIAITGTNGKTTCVRLLTDILNSANKKAVSVGNIGYPLSQALIEQKKVKYFVCEVSSFQLETIRDFKPKIACILNITSDHINRHKTFSNYKKAKLRLYKNLNGKDYLVSNLNSNLQLNKFIAKKYYFGFKNIKNGCFLFKNSIFFAKNGKNQKICSCDDFSLIGKHNIENVLACICLAKILKIKNKYIIKTLKKFKVSPHRLQKVFSYNNVNFYDDSKATNIDATLCAINSFNKPTTLILGGSDKGYNYDEIFKKLPDYIKYILACGEVKEKILNSAKKYNKNIFIFDNLKQATIFACENILNVENVLLSPASASFDEFSSYKERGEKFLEYIKDFYGKK